MGSVLLLAMVLVPAAFAPLVTGHGGVDDGHADVPLGDESDVSAYAVNDVGLDQQHPALWRDLLVYQQNTGGDRGFDIIGTNLTTGTSFTIVGQTGHQTTPDIDRSIVVWVEHRGTDTDVVMMDLAQGRIRVLGGTAAKESAPTVSWPYVVWMVKDDEGQRFAAYDLEDQRPVSIATGPGRVGGVSTWGGHIVWMQANGTQWVIHDWTEALDRPVEMIRGGGSFSGPSAGPAGVVYLAYRDGFKTHHLQWDGTMNELDTKIQPHANPRLCKDTIVWDQPADGFGAGRGVALWDLVVDRAYVFFPRNSRPDCSADWLVFEKALGEQGSRIYAQDAILNRPTRPPELVFDPGQNGAILEFLTEITGHVIMHDPRRPLVSIEAYVDGNRPVEAVLFLDETNTYQFRLRVDPGRFLPGEHRLAVAVFTDTGLNGVSTFTFYAVNANGIEQAHSIINANRYVSPDAKERSGFDALTHHYDVYSRFYNSILMLLIIIAVLAWFLIRHLKTRPRGRPEIVR